ncbi:MAG: type II toxin-antitoxin system RelE/ParE family toxin [Methanomicrobiales archaeon]
MLKYSISFTRRAKKNLMDIPAEVRHKIEGALFAFASDPGPHHDVKKMHGSHKSRPLYRLCVGEYRVLKYLYNGTLVVEVISVLKREMAY